MWVKCGLGQQIARLASLWERRRWGGAVHHPWRRPTTMTRREVTTTSASPPYGSSPVSAGASSRSAASAGAKMTVHRLNDLYKAKIPLTCLTAYDYPTGLHVQKAGVDICLVGDSLAMVACGYETTKSLRLEEMLYHCQSVARAAKTPFLMADLPFGSYEKGAKQAMESTTRLLQEGGMDGVKIEGGREVSGTIQYLASYGIPVSAHIGLMPQRAAARNGYRKLGGSVNSARAILSAALQHQSSKADFIVLEAIPAPLAKYITRRLSIPTIGIGAGPDTSGQVLVQLDLLGGAEDARYPKFVKTYAAQHTTSVRAIQAYVRDVQTKRFPASEHTYSMNQWEEFLATVEGNKGLAEQVVADVVDEGEVGEVEASQAVAASPADDSQDEMLQQVKESISAKRQIDPEEEVTRILQGFGDRRAAIARLHERAEHETKTGPELAAQGGDLEEIKGLSDEIVHKAKASPMASRGFSTQTSRYSRPSGSRAFHSSPQRREEAMDDPPGWYDLPNSAQRGGYDQSLLAPNSINHVFRGRSVRVTDEYGNLGLAVRRLNHRLRLNNVKRELKLGERYEKPTKQRRRLASERHRRRFRELVKKKAWLVIQMKSRGL